ncbi:IrmA family protein [Brenneria populi subsp. brevivirga]|uniref:IrmA family protein n=1 Tax=Brenneria populi TaxID=1505588 RepID=UPI002E1775BA|nr:IrmA family protein [Brenneria populi subsp. brevivirga]
MYGLYKVPILSLVIALAVIGNVHAIEIRHTDTVWAGQGACSAQFTLDNGGAAGEPIGNLEITVNVSDKNGKILQKDTLNVEPFGDSDATRYQIAYLEGESYCEDALTINIVKSVETVKGKKKNRPLAEFTTSEFKPYTVLVNGKKATQ